MIKKSIKCCLFILLLTCSAKSQGGFFFVIRSSHNIDSIYYRSTTHWFVLTPFAFSAKSFSPDNGATWKHAGIIGGNLTPYIKDNPDALKSLHTYKTLRLLGITQMAVIAPYFLIKQINWTSDYNQTGPPYKDVSSPNYILGFFGFLYTGAITYHLISKPFFIKAISQLHSKRTSTTTFNEKYVPHIGFNYDMRYKIPMTSIGWQF